MDQIAAWKHAYQVLDAPLNASTATIRQCYRRLVKRWHPDHNVTGAEEYAEATQMTRMINEAYSAVKGAPLRYHIDACPTTYVERRQASGERSTERPRVDSDTFPKTDRTEYTVRFVCGAVLGALLSVRPFLFYYDQQGTIIPFAIAMVLLCGFFAARYGDRFWHSFFRNWWLWW